MNQATSTWPKKNAVVVSQSSNLLMFLKELLRTQGWSIEKATPSVGEAMALISQKKAFLLIIDDSPDYPSAAIVREVLSHYAFFATPIFGFLLDEHALEAKGLNTLKQVKVVNKPLTPSRFLPAFTELVRRWEMKPYAALRVAIQRYLLERPREGAVQVLEGFFEVAAIQSLVAPILAIEHSRLGNLHAAEKTLLQALKAAPRDLGCLLTLTDLYMKAAMPHLAKRLLTAVQGNFGRSSLLLPDLMMTEVLLGHYDDALDVLKEMKKNKYWLAQTQPAMARLLQMLGREDEAELIMQYQKGLLLKIKKAWSSVHEVAS